MKVEEALDLARRYHAGQTDQAGQPYMGHVERVVARVTDPDEKLAAALHDVLEDTPLTTADLERAGCPPRVLVAVEALTRRPDERYSEFVRRASDDPIARAVKLADLDDNADEARLALLPPELASRLRSKYASARLMLGETSHQGGDDG